LKVSVLVTAAAVLALNVVAPAAQAQHLNPVIDLLVGKKQVFGLYAPSNPRVGGGRGGRGGPPGAPVTPPPVDTTTRKTPGELAADLKSAYAEHLKYPNVTVIVREMLQQKVYVAGEVVQPGMVDLPGPMSVLEAVMGRGGFDMTTAEISSVVVMRHENGKRVGYKVDLKEAFAGGEVEPFMLQPQDIVFVPRTAVVNVNNFLEQYVAGVIPQSGFVYTRQTGDASFGIDTSR